MRKPLLEFTPKGLYCSKGKFYIDPWKPVDQALITHAHSDHAYWGHNSYLAHHFSIPILRHRLGRPDAQFYGIEYNESIMINGVKVSFHPAGHIIGSAQIRVEDDKQVWVASGDYKLENDGISDPFEPVKCDVFITESTFGLPCFQWEPQSVVFDDINAWWKSNYNQGLTSILLGYALGKAQRLLKGVDSSIGPIFGHGSIWNLTEIIRDFCPKLPKMDQIIPLKLKKTIPQPDTLGALILAPPSAINSPWMNRFHPYRVGYASGWMTLRGMRKRIGADRGFILSDHADWNGLQQAIKETEAKKIIVNHGFVPEFARWLHEQGIESEEAKILHDYSAEDVGEED